MANGSEMVQNLIQKVLKFYFFLKITKIAQRLSRTTFLSTQPNLDIFQVELLDVWVQETDKKTYFLYDFHSNLIVNFFLKHYPVIF